MCIIYELLTFLSTMLQGVRLRGAEAGEQYGQRLPSLRGARPRPTRHCHRQLRHQGHDRPEQGRQVMSYDVISCVSAVELCAIWS